MALVRCPSCGRVADGKMCFACGYEWPEGGAAAPPSPAPSQTFKIAAPTSYPTAAVVPPAAPTPPAMPPDDGEIDLDVDFDERRASDSWKPDADVRAPSQTLGAFPETRAPSQAPGSFPPSFPPPSSAFGAPVPSSFAPAFPTASASFPPAFPSASGAFGPGAFGGFPANAFSAPPSSPPAPADSAWPPPAAPTPPPAAAWPPAAPAAPTPAPSAPWAQPAAPTPPPADAWPAPAAAAAWPPADPPIPAIPAAPDPWAGAGPPAPAQAPTPAVLDPWAGMPAQAAQGAATVAVRAPSMNFGSSPSWVSNPTVQVPSNAGALLAGLAPLPSVAVTPPQMQAPVPQAAPASLSGLFDGINGTAAEAPVSTPPSAFDDDGLNFTLEPGATLEPDPVEAVPAAAVIGTRPPSSRGLAIELADDAASVPPPGASVGVDGGFAELDALDLDSPVDDLLDVAADEAELVEETSFEIAEDVPEPPPPAPAPPAPPAAPQAPPPAFAAAADDDDMPTYVPGVATYAPEADESSFADVDFALEHDVPAGLDGEAAFDALGLEGLGSSDLDAIDVDGSLDALAELDRQISSAESALASTASSAPSAPSVPSLSGRVGTLAESLEAEGRIGDAAMLYEVQAVLAATGR